MVRQTGGGTGRGTGGIEFVFWMAFWFFGLVWLVVEFVAVIPRNR